MEITIDLSRLGFISTQGQGKFLWYIFSHGGWLILILAIVFLIFYIRLYITRKKYIAGIEQTLLAIDIPKDNEQSLVAVEQIFATLAGIKIKRDLFKKYWLGKIQPWFSLEIISLEGYIQFLIRTPAIYRDLAEAAIYAQYPEAEITEVEDYVNLIPDDVHEIKSEFNLWGTEFKLAKESGYPIKTYKSFEHPLTQQFIDPMASLLEVMSKLGKGEQLCLQFLIAPVNDDWKEKGYQLVRRLIGDKTEAPKHLGDKLVDISTKGLEKFSEAIIKLWGDIEEKKADQGAPNLMQYLTPGERQVVESIQNKLSQICFETKFRLYYLAHTDVYQIGRGVNAVIGAINQFKTTNLNAFETNKRITTNVDYLFPKSRISYRQKRLVKYYKNRSFTHGSAPFLLSTEELATIYHFPTITVKAPLLKKTEAKKAEPPTALPVGFTPGREFFRSTVPKKTADLEKTEALPSPELTSEKEAFIIEESLPGYDFDNEYFEEKFAKDKSTIKPEAETADTADEKIQPPSNLPVV